MRITLVLVILMIISPWSYSQTKSTKKNKAAVSREIPVRGMGMVFRPEIYNTIPNFSTSVFIEATRRKLALRNTNFSVQAPPPGDQGSIGSCVGWAVGYTFLSSYLQRNTVGTIIWNSTNMRSPGFVYHFAKINNDCAKSGCYMNVGLECIRDNGSCNWALWPGNGDCNKTPLANEAVDACGVSSPWKRGKEFTCPTGDEDGGNRDQQRKNSLASGKDGPELWQRMDITDVNAMKGVLFQYKWPIIVAFNVTNSFQETWWNGGYWITNNNSNLGGHAVCIVGYDDNKTFNGKRGMFKCQNSWGLGFGDHGYFWVSYDLVRKKCFREVYLWTRNESITPPCTVKCPM